MNGCVPAKKDAVVLLATADPEVRQIAGKALLEDGLSVEEAADGTQALEDFERLRPDLVLLDVDVSSLNGLAVCAELRSVYRDDLTPILLIIRPDDNRSLNRVSDVGATDFITKPVRELVFKQRVQCVLDASRSRDALAKLEARNNTFLDALPDLMFQIRRGGEVLDLRPTKHSRFLSEDYRWFEGQRVSDLFPSEIAEHFIQRVDQALDSDEDQVFEYSLLTDEDMRDFEARVVISDVDRGLVIVRDVTERKQAEKQIRFLAFHDGLTGLRNRTSFVDYLRESINRLKFDESLIAVMFLDLDGFKRFNDQFGHSIGDLLLRKIAARLSSCIRASDAIARHTGEEPEATMGRFGGDEFTILVTNISRAEEAAIVARRLLGALSSPFRMGRHDISVTASIGISIFPLDGDCAETLLQNADRAMYAAKGFERHSYHFYNAGALERLSLENDLQKAVEQGEFKLYFQPKVDARTGRITGTEALLRWQHPQKGMVSPGHFIQLAEETGLIFRISDWVLRSASLQRLSWQKIGVSSTPVAVNISGLQFAHSDLVKNVSQILSETNLDPACLELEITENTVMQSVDSVITVLRELKGLGVRISVDDFGTGYSSLSYLKRFPLDAIKIDRSFVKDIQTDPDSRAIITAIIRMAHSLDLKVIAEGVEEPEQLSFLIEQDCDELQGFLFSRPVPTEEMTRLLEEDTRGSLPWDWITVIRGEQAASKLAG